MCLQLLRSLREVLLGSWEVDLGPWTGVLQDSD